MKQYNNEKAMICLTSWKARINTVYKTINSLYDICKGFHIVLTLAEEEFPEKENELPNTLMDISDKFELIWCKKNYLSFKKCIFAMKKYPNIPFIVTDDDVIAKKNFAEIFYNAWIKDKSNYSVSLGVRNLGYGPISAGCMTLYSPNCFGDAAFRFLLPEFYSVKYAGDDNYYGFLRQKLSHVKSLTLNFKREDLIEFHDSIEPLERYWKGVPCHLYDKYLTIDESYEIPDNVYSADNSILIIGNNCLSGYIYRDVLNIKYNVPFIWTKIYEHDFLTLVENINSIDFNNIELYKATNNLRRFGLLIDNKFKVDYWHYFFDKKYEKPTVIGVDIFYNKIWEYIVNVYNKRLERMLPLCNKNIIIAVDNVDDTNVDYKSIYKLCKDKYKLIYINNECSDYECDKNVLYIPKLKHNDGTFYHPCEYANLYKDKIKDFCISRN